MEFPNFQPNQYCVIEAESMTGIILNLDGNRHKGEEVAILVFDSLEAAETYSKQKVLLYPEIECNIYNQLKERIARITSLRNDPF